MWLRAPSRANAARTPWQWLGIEPPSTEGTEPAAFCVFCVILHSESGRIVLWGISDFP